MINEKEALDYISQDILELMIRTERKPTLPDMQRCARKIFCDLKFIFEQHFDKKTNEG